MVSFLNRLSDQTQPLTESESAGPGSSDPSPPAQAPDDNCLYLHEGSTGDSDLDGDGIPDGNDPNPIDPCYPNPSFCD